MLEQKHALSTWKGSKVVFTLWLFNIAMENGPFIDDFPINTSIYTGFSMAMLNNQMVSADLILAIFQDFQWDSLDSRGA